VGSCWRCPQAVVVLVRKISIRDLAVLYVVCNQLGWCVRVEVACGGGGAAGAEKMVGSKWICRCCDLC